MKEVELIEWINRSKNKSVLMEFVAPKTPAIVQWNLGIKKLNLKPFLKRNLIKCLNENSRKGRLYITTPNTRKLLSLSVHPIPKTKSYDLHGWILSSPKQRVVVLKTLSTDSVKRTSEEIRIRSSKLNPCLSRISTKTILNELVERNLVDTEMSFDRRRYYWIKPEGKSVSSEITELGYDVKREKNI